MQVFFYYILKYRDREFIDENSECFVDIDQPSGGYPYKVDFHRAKRFRTEEAAKNYSRGEFDICIVNCNVYNIATKKHLK